MGLNTFPCNPYPISTEELNKGNNDELNTRVTALEGDVSDLEEQKANQITIALPFNPETEYAVGDLVYYNGLTYRCTNEHTGEWDADDFAGTTIANELSALKSGLIGVTPIKVDGHTPENQGFAGFNTSGLDLLNRYPVAFFIVSNTENVPYMIAQGSADGISVSFDPTTHNPNLYILGTAGAEWKDTDCFVIYV